MSIKREYKIEGDSGHVRIVTAASWPDAAMAWEAERPLDRIVRVNDDAPYSVAMREALGTRA